MIPITRVQCISKDFNGFTLTHNGIGTSLKKYFGLFKRTIHNFQSQWSCDNCQAEFQFFRGLASPHYVGTSLKKYFRLLGHTVIPHYIISITHSNTTLPNFQSHWSCDNCQAEFPHDLIHGKLAKFEAEIENIKSSEPEEFEKLLRKMSLTLHENHYWILDVKRRLIDIYGNKEGFELYKLPKVGNSSGLKLTGHYLMRFEPN